MNAENFAYWINGAIELGQLTTFNEEQVKIIQDHIGLVIKKVTPQYGITHSPITTLPQYPSTPLQLTC